MSNIVTQNTNLPAHLMGFSDLGLSINENVLGGLKQGGHASIGIKASKWRLKEGADETVLDGTVLRAIIVDANPHKSKVYYAQAYNPKADIKGPDCYSDNGVGPSSKATSPQSSACATCPQNVWGSKISANGNKTRACSDYKKLAVVLADDIDRGVFELRIPPASLEDLNKVMTALHNRKVPLPLVAFDLYFDPKEDFPKIMFKPTGYINAEDAEAIRKWVGSQEAKEAVGRHDVASSAAPQVAQEKPVAAVAPPAPKNDMAFLDEPAPEAPRRRGRPAKAEHREPAPEAPVGQMTFDLPGSQAAAQSTPVEPAKTDEGLDNLLAGFM